MPAVHALTDVTGFGLAGHLLEICRGSKVGASLRFKDLPLIDQAVELAQQGVATGASNRNWKSYGADIDLPEGFPEWRQKLITDPQTSGGLLVACDPEAVAAVLQVFRQEGFGGAALVGELTAGAPRLRVF
jgi:selenide,water dikinase